MLNLDKICIQANVDNLMIIGEVARKKQEKNNDDSRVSVTAVRVGSAGGTEGPWIFLAAGKEMTCRMLTPAQL